MNEFKKHHRRSIRLQGYDYSRPGAYFITICAQNRECLFGEINDGKMELNDAGEIVAACWEEPPNHFTHVELDTWVIMPNHVHGIILLNNSVGARYAVPLQQQNAVPLQREFGKPVSGSLSTILRSFKSAVTQKINRFCQTPGNKLWQRNYYEHIIRDKNEHGRIAEYIKNNPLKWELDSVNPDNQTR